MSSLAGQWVTGSRSGEEVLVRPRTRASEPGLVAVLIGVVARLSWWAVRYPHCSLPLIATLWALRAYGLLPVLAAWLVMAAGLMLWRAEHRQSFDVAVTPWRTTWRTYRYHRYWQPVMVGCGLADGFAGSVLVPRLRKVRSTPVMDRLRVDMLPGQTPSEFVAQAEAFAHAFAARKVTVRVEGWRGAVWLHVWWVDLLADIVPVSPLPADGADVDLAALPLGLTEDGSRWRHRLLGTHLLLAGASGSGKGSVLWGLVRSLAPAVREGRVQLWGIDPKNGVELGFGRNLFTRYWDGVDLPAAAAPVETVEPEEAQTTRRARKPREDSDPRLVALAELLEDAVALLQARAERMRGVSRLHTPTVAEPLVVLVIDEFASLTAYLTDRAVAKRIDAAMQVILTKGRAPGVLVVAALQDPRKEIVAYRDLFTTRIALRMMTREATDMVLGDGSVARGAACQEIPLATPGVGYVVVDGEPSAVQVRAAYVTDHEIRAIAAQYPAPVNAAAQPSEPKPEPGSESPHLGVVDGQAAA